VLITAVSHRRMPYFENLVGQVAPQALPDLRKYPIWNIQFLFDQTGCFSGRRLGWHL